MAITTPRHDSPYRETPEGPVEVTQDISEQLGKNTRTDYATGQVRPLSRLRLWKDGRGEAYVDGGSAHSFSIP